MDNHDQEEQEALPADTLAILTQFLNEKEERNRRLQEALERNLTEGDLELEEDWQLSQFWYDDETCQTLTKEIVRLRDANSSSEEIRVACVSCPTLYRALRLNKLEKVSVKLLEFDTRFAAYGEDFVMYDFSSPLDLPRDFRSAFDVVIADPPFLSEECLTKTAVTIRYLTKGPVILCTGAIMTELANRLLSVTPSSRFFPKHKNNLANEFRCFANYDIDAFLNP
nr:EOG090X0ABW [Triops cancriformis]